MIYFLEQKQFFQLQNLNKQLTLKLYQSIQKIIIYHHRATLQKEKLINIIEQQKNRNLSQILAERYSYLRQCEQQKIKDLKRQINTEGYNKSKFVQVQDKYHPYSQKKEMQHQQLGELIQKIISSKSNDEIQASEDIFKNYKKQNNDEFIINMLNIITSDNYTKHLKLFVINQIRSSLSEYSRSTNSISLIQINQTTINLLQDTLIQQLSNEKNKQLRIQISETIGEVGATLLNKQLWNELINQLWGLFSQQNLEIQYCAFIILRNLINYSHQVFSNNLNDLNILISNGLQHLDKNIKIESIKTLGVILEYFESKQCKLFSNLSLTFLEAVYSILTSNNNVENQNDETKNDYEDDLDNCVVNVVFDITEKEASFFKNSFNEFYIAITKMIQDYPKPDIQRLLIESLINFIERFPEKIKNQKDKIENILHLILLQMIQVDGEITEEWMNPKGGFQDEFENDERSESIKFGWNLINSFIPCFDDNIVLDLVIINIKKMFEEGELKQDWRYHYSAIMTLSQIGEFIDDIESLEPLLKLAYQYSFQQQNILLRYAFCHTIGQISDDMAPLFQETYGEDLLPKLISMLDDNIPRVRAHAAAAIVNFVESMDKDIINPHLKTLLEKIFNLINNGIIKEKQQAVTALSSIIESAKGYFEKYLPEVLYNLQQHINKSLNDPQLRQFCGNILQCISISSRIMRKSAFLPHLESFIETLINISQIIKNQSDFQNEYIFDAWNRLAHKYHEELQPLLPNIMPLLLMLVGNVLIQDNKKQSLDSEEVQSAIKLVSTFASKFNNSLSEYIEEIYDLVQNQMTSYNESIRETACKSLPNLLNCAKNNPERLKQLLKQLIQDLCSVIDCEQESQLIIVQLQSMKQCIQEGNTFITNTEFKFLSNQLMKLLQESDRRKQQVKQKINDEDIDQLQKCMIPDEYKTEEQIHIEIAHVLGSLYKSHQEQASTFSTFIYANIIPKAFQDSSQVLLIKFGMILLQDIVKYIGYASFCEKWEEIINVFLNQLNHDSLIIKKESLYGLACIIESTPSNALQTQLQVIEEIALEYIKNSGVFIDQNSNQIIKDISKQAQNSQQNKLKDYAVDILGKLLKYHGSQFNNSQNLYQLWIGCLPIQTEKRIAEDQHQIYLQYLINQQHFIQNESKDTLQNIFKILSEFYEPKICTPLLKNILDQFLSQFLENTLIATAYNETLCNLSKVQQKRLQDAVNNKKQEQSYNNNMLIHQII